MRPQAEHRRLPEPLGEGRGNRAATAATPGRAAYTSGLPQQPSPETLASGPRQRALPRHQRGTAWYVRHVAVIVTAPYTASSRSIATAFSASMTTVALSPPPTMLGITDASTTRSPCRPCTRSRWSTTSSGPGPMRQLPTGW
jgi:hypothetical protein